MNAILKSKQNWDKPIILGGSAAETLRADAKRLGVPLEDLLQQYLKAGRRVVALKNKYPNGELIFRARRNAR